ncbi:MAG: YggS family pyridoxal phosphate-dependent enzyme [Actinomycetia bacterium]|nr:YggS family pyridoxal phosphate-dependent enzyme [Actinomycetes bacterium]
MTEYVDGPVPDGLTAELIHERHLSVLQRIEEAGGDPEEVSVLAVTKAFGLRVAELAVEAGLTSLGENYAQELEAKARAQSPTLAEVDWHFIGRLQRNKVKKLVGIVGVWESVDRQALVDEIARRDPGARILIQVNTEDEEGKGGCPISEAGALAAHALEHGLDVGGLMTVGPTDQSIDPTPGFRAVAALAGDLGLAERSMGMTADLEEAVAAGTTTIRVGRALFGPRKK